MAVVVYESEMLFAVSRNSHCLHEIHKFGHTAGRSLALYVSVCLCIGMPFLRVFATMFRSLSSLLFASLSHYCV